jgi:hypothetical protein
MIDRDPRDVVAELAARIERLEAMMVLLCEQAMRGQGQMGKPFQQFIDDWRREHSG